LCINSQRKSKERRLKLNKKLVRLPTLIALISLFTGKQKSAGGKLKYKDITDSDNRMLKSIDFEGASTTLRPQMIAREKGHAEETR
jgi:hypothetical protein